MTAAKTIVPLLPFRQEEHNEKCAIFNLATREKCIYIMKNEWKVLCNYLKDVWSVRNNTLST